MWISHQTKRQRLLATWDHPAPRFRNFVLIARYYDLTQAEPAYHRLNDQTWADLNGEEVFAQLDTTTSRVGQQCLYQRLRSPLADAEVLAEFDAAAAFFTQQPAIRGQALLALSRLTATEAYYLPDLLPGNALPPLPGAGAAPVLVGLLLATLLGGFWLPLLWVGSVALLVTNALFHFWHRSRIMLSIRPVLQVGSLYRVGRELARLGLPFAPLQGLTTPLARLAAIVSRVALLQLENQMQSDMAMAFWLVLQYIKMVLLLDVLVYGLCRRAVQQQAGAIRAVFEAVGYADCALAVASFRQRCPYCVPAFAPAGAALRLTAAYNPLVAGCVPNNLTMAEAGTLFTGSNMAGKTTFMRTIGLNALLAQTIATCPAASYAAPFCRVLSSLNLADSLPEGKSYYLVEAEVVLQLIRASEAEPGSYLFLLDELFKGTNTVERIAVTQAVLAYLQPRSRVVASTHDGELGELLRAQFSEYHFCETVTATDWYFDYELKPGPLTTRNAIRLLARAGYPAAIVQQAQALSASFEAAASG
ncbi:MAG: MutS-related protein [Janthinobacterium lividum]